jgi:hypothetical protein
LARLVAILGRYNRVELGSACDLAFSLLHKQVSSIMNVFS